MSTSNLKKQHGLSSKFELANGEDDLMTKQRLLLVVPSTNKSLLVFFTSLAMKRYKLLH
jgi:hypothetical protein